MTDVITTRVERSTYKKLQQVKLDMDSKSLSDTIDRLIEAYNEAKEGK